MARGPEGRGNTPSTCLTTAPAETSGVGELLTDLFGAGRPAQPSQGMQRKVVGRENPMARCPDAIPCPVLHLPSRPPVHRPPGPCPSSFQPSETQVATQRTFSRSKGLPCRADRRGVSRAVAVRAKCEGGAPAPPCIWTTALRHAALPPRARLWMPSETDHRASKFPLVCMRIRIPVHTYPQHSPLRPHPGTPPSVPL